MLELNIKKIKKCYEAPNTLKASKQIRYICAITSNPNQMDKPINNLLVLFYFALSLLLLNY